MSTTIIKNGTIVTADLTYKADVKIEDGVITEIGPNLSGGDEVARRDRLLCHAGRHRSAHPSRNAVHGHLFSDDFESGTRAALSGGTTMVVDFCLPSPGQSLLGSAQMWDNKSTRANCDYSFHMAITWWGEQVFNEMETVVARRASTPSSTSWPTRAR
jgi:dihydropyrimidinase